METLLDQKDSGKKAYVVPTVRITDMSDEELVEMIQKGSEAAFAEITRRYMQKSYALAYQMVSDMEVARDLSQDVFIKIYSSINNFKQGSKFFSWFYRILMNHCINYTRRKKRLTFLPFSEVFLRTGENPDERLLEQENDEDVSERKQVIRDAINRLSPKHQRVIILCDIEGFPQEEVAEILGVAIGTVRSQLHYARQNLKNILKKYITEI